MIFGHSKLILRPNERNWWEREAIFNPASKYRDGVIHLIARAVGDLSSYISRFSYYVSEDGYDFEQRINKPIFGPGRYEGGWAPEDPRISELGGNLYMSYVVVSGGPCAPAKVRSRLGIPHKAPAKRGIAQTYLALIEDFDKLQEGSKKFIKMEIGVITPPKVHDRDTVLFPEKIKGRYVALHRPSGWIGSVYGTDRPSIWITYSEDLKNWYGHKLVMRPKERHELKKIGAGPPPLKTEDGWLLIFHGVDEEHVYTGGLALLDLEDPSRVIARSPHPVLKSEKSYGLDGEVPNVIFPTGLELIGDEVFVFSGVNDIFCRVDRGYLDKILDHLVKYRLD